LDREQNRKPLSTGRLSTHLNFATPLTIALERLAEGAGIGIRQVAMAWQMLLKWTEVEAKERHFNGSINGAFSRFADRFEAHQPEERQGQQGGDWHRFARILSQCGVGYPRCSG